jgi:phage protein D
MSDKKQIEEMANDIAKICTDLVESGCGQINCVTHLTLSLYKEGYRKQSEGEWIKEHIYSRNWDDHYNLTCSVCGAVIIDAPNEYKYCHECGAKMKGGEDNA